MATDSVRIRYFNPFFRHVLCRPGFLAIRLIRSNAMKIMNIFSAPGTAAVFSPAALADDGRAGA
jgi:hypothetical protein